MTRLPPIPDGGDLPRAPGLLIAPKVGVAGMLFAFLLAVAAFVGVGLLTGGGVEDPVGTQPGRVQMDSVDDAALSGLLPEEASRRLQDELHAFARDPARGAVADDAPEMDLEWTRFLLAAELRNRLAALPPRVFPRLENVPAAFEDPGAVRGTLVALWGRVEDVQEIDLTHHPDGARVGWRLTISDASGVPWIVTTPREPEDAVTAGRWVKAFGVFTKLWPDADGRARLHVLLTRQVIPSFPPVTHRQPRLEWLEQVRDGTPHESDGYEAEPFYGMLNYVRQLGPSGYRELRDTEHLTVTDLSGTMGSTPLWQQPDRWRFQLVRLRLAPIRDRFVVDRFLEENPGNIDMVFRGYLVDDQNHPVLFISPFPRDAFDFGGWRLVEVEGFFYKRRLVAGANDKQYWLPVLIGTAVDPIDTGAYEGNVPLWVVLALLGAGSLAAVVALVVVWMREKRREEEVRRRSAERRARRQQSAAP